MDYCHACRRHLNGALACAGCGTPAERLGQPAAVEPEVYELDVRADLAPPGHRRARRRPGRARRARRRSGRRTVLFATLGVALAGGALSLAELATEAPQDGAAAASVREEDRPTEPPASGTADSENPGRPAAVPAAQRSAAAGTGAPTGDSTAPAPAATASAAEGPGADGRTTPPGVPQPSSATPVTSEPGRGDGTGAPATRSPSAQPPPPATPEPQPTETCTRFLWWCT